MTYRIFLSHFSADRPIVNAIGELIDHAFAGHVAPFISSAIPTGINWLAQVQRELSSSDEVLTVFTHRSVERPWVNIETGYGIMVGKPVIPVLFGGLSTDDLSVFYQLQQSVDECSDNSIRQLFTDILKRVVQKLPQARSVLTPEQFLIEWRSKVSTVVLKTPQGSTRPIDTPLLWVIGSHDGLSSREQQESIAVIRTIARVAFQNRFRLVCGVSRLLEYLADSHEAINSPGGLPSEISGDPWRKALGMAHVEAKGQAHNPVIIVGTLRTPDIRQRFDDALGRIPNLAIVVGGRSKASGGRTHDECTAAVAAGIPLLPISFTGGAAAEAQPSLSANALALVPKLLASQGKLDEFSVALVNIVQEQLQSA